MIIKKHETSGSCILAICDNHLLGKTIKEGNKQMEVSKQFYEGKETKEEILASIRDGTIFNIVGDESIKFALKNNLITKDNIKKIGGVPYAQSF
ncbi:MAG: DUF424 family protein [Nanoarchaeota archaeon]